jgi:hypothetical protein
LPVYKWAEMVKTDPPYMGGGAGGGSFSVYILGFRCELYDLYTGPTTDTKIKLCGKERLIGL